MGWGEVTPDAYWYMQCGQCLAGHVDATMTPWGSMTPEITGTPGTLTPEVSETPSATQPTATATLEEPFYWVRYMGQFPKTWVGDAVWSEYYAASAYEPVGRIIIATNQEIGGILYYKFGSTAFFFHDHTTLGDWNGICLGESGHDDLCTEVVPDWVYGSYGPYKWGSSDVTGDGVITFETNQCGTCSTTVTVDFYYVYWSEDVPPPTPTPGVPTATPTGTAYPGYCGEVQEGGGSGGFSMEGVELPVPMVGEAACYGIGDWDLPDLGETELYFPGMQLCFVPFQIGDLQILNMVIDVDWMITVMAGIWVLRMILRS